MQDLVSQWHCRSCQLKLDYRFRVTIALLTVKIFNQSVALLTIVVEVKLTILIVAVQAWMDM